jgi:hypothetical protein
LLDDGAGLSLGRCIQLLHVGKGPLGVSVVLGDGLHLQVEAMLSCQLEASVLISKVLTFMAQDTLHLGHGSGSCAHGLTQGNVVRCIRGGG